MATENQTEEASLEALLTTPLERQTLAGTIRRRLRDAIVSGRIRSQQKLVETQLAKELGVSRAPVREALQQLEQDGLLVSDGRGYAVSSVTLEDLEELFTLRIALERLAVARMIERATDEQIGELSSIVARMRELEGESADMATIVAIDTEFHERICGLSRHGRLLQAWTNMRAQIEVGIHASNAAFPADRNFANSHEVIVEALIARDRARGEDVIEKHLMNGLRQLTEAGTFGTVA